MKLRSSLLFVVAMLFCLSGCGDSEEEKKDDVSGALSRFLKEKPPQISVSVNFPVELSDGDMKAKKLTPFVAAGVLSAEAVKVKARGFAAVSADTVPGKKYQLTELGQSLVVDVDKGSGGFGRKTSFRFADAELEQVENTTEPSEMNGYTIVRASYSYKATNEVKALTGSDAVRAQFPQIEKILAGSQKDKAVLIKTEKGLVHEKLADL